MVLSKYDVDLVSCEAASASIVGPVVHRADDEGGGEQSGRDEEGKATNYVHRWFVPIAGRRVAEPLGAPSMLVTCNTIR